MSAESSDAKTEKDPAILAEVARQKAIILRGTIECLSEADLERKLYRSIEKKRPLRVKLGVDPTADLLHLGFSVGLGKLRAFQDLGHQAVLIIGDATARVGDPTGRNLARPRLTLEDVRRNAAGYLDQAARILDLEKAEVVRNGDWLAQFDFEGMVRLASRATVAQMLERDDFAKRHRDGVPIHLHELIYPLLQGWDSVEVRADIELGGSDQLFNLLVGRDLQSQEGQESQVCITTALLVGLDGQKKMSKSFGNTIGITEAPEEMMKKVMRIDDALLADWFLLLTETSEADIKALLESGQNPRDLKLELGRRIVARFHDEAAGARAAEAWLAEVSRKELPDELPECSVASLPGKVPLLDLLVTAGFAKSKSEARRLVTQGAVSLDGERLEDPLGSLRPRGGEVLRAGKKKICRLAR